MFESPLSLEDKNYLVGVLIRGGVFPGWSKILSSDKAYIEGLVDKEIRDAEEAKVSQEGASSVFGGGGP